MVRRIADGVRRFALPGKKGMSIDHTVCRLKHPIVPAPEDAPGCNGPAVLLWPSGTGRGLCVENRRAISSRNSTPVLFYGSV